MTTRALIIQRSRDGAATLALAGAFGIGGGVLVAAGSIGGIGICLVIACVLLGLSAPAQLPRIAIGAMGGALLGYAFLGRGFAYLGVGPVFVGELVLGASLVALVAAGGLAVPLRSPITWLYLVFAGWGAVRAIGDIGTYGMDTVRDSAVWYYGLFLLVGAWLFSERARTEQTVRCVARATPWLLAWIPIAYALTLALGDRMPRTPGSDVAFIAFKGGDMSIYLALAVVFVLACRSTTPPFTQRWPIWSIWLLAMVDFLIIATKNRGGLLAFVAAVTIALVLQPRLRVVQGIAIGMAVLSLVAIADVRVPLDDGRELSVGQLQENVASVMEGHAQGSGAHSTAGWRLSFWRDIVNDTVHGEHGGTGLGFGINLADHYGYQVNEDGSLRSPHNATMTILARMGVPGAVVWIVLNLAYAAAILRALLVARRERDEFWQPVFLLLLVHWIASSIDASFDPYLEGPQGAIGFWLTLGIGVGSLHAFGERHTGTASSRPRTWVGRARVASRTRNTRTIRSVERLVDR